MKSEFKRFGIEKAGALTTFLEILGALGLLLGFKVHPILLTAGGLSILMLIGVAIRIKFKDSLGSLHLVFYNIKRLYFLSRCHIINNTFVRLYGSLIWKKVWV